MAFLTNLEYRIGKISEKMKIWRRSIIMLVFSIISKLIFPL